VRENSIRKCRNLIAKIEEQKNLQEKPKMFVKSGQTKSPRRLYLQLASGKLTRRAPCIYRTAAFENRTIG
jgi:hypothetical protein